MSAKRRSGRVPPRTDVVSASTTVSAPNGDGPLSASGVPDPPELAGVLEKIAACRQLPENWDGEDAFSISEEVVSRARDLVTRVAEEAYGLGLHWQDPAIAPSPDGAIELSWEAGERWVLLVILPGEAILECVLQDSGSSPTHSKVSVEEGLQRALWAMGRAPHDTALAP